jgi:hypothetical protein
MSRETFDQEKQKLYKSFIPFKSPLQSALTSIMYRFKHNNKNINIWMEKNSQYIFVTLFDYFSKSFNIDKKDLWKSFRFYLKGGKALNKLLRSICNEEKYKILLADTKSIVQKDKKEKCFVNTELFPSSDTDFDYTLLIKKDEFLQNNLAPIQNTVVKILNSVANYMNENDEFNVYKNALLKHINSEKNIKKILSSVRDSLTELENAILNEEDRSIKSYFEFKQVQINHFIKSIEKCLSEKQNMFSQCVVNVSYGTKPIVLESSSFYLYRLKLFFDLNRKIFHYKKTNKDIVDFLKGYAEVTASPYDNTFAELIDLSIPIGNDQYLEKLWKYTNYDDMLQPITYFQPNVYAKKVYRYPAVSLRHQMNDIITIFNVEGSTKLPKRCNRFLQFLKIFCHAEKIPDEFTIYFSKELKKELYSENTQCEEMTKVIIFLSNKMQVAEDYTIKVKASELQKTFPEYCKRNTNVNFTDRQSLLNLLLPIAEKFEVDSNGLEKLNTPSLTTLVNLVENNDAGKLQEYMRIVGSLAELERIIPLELVLD